MGISWTDPALEADARDLARRYGLALADPGQDATASTEQAVLVLTPERLELRPWGASHGSEGAVATEFVGGAEGYRQRHPSPGRELLSRAVLGPRKAAELTVVDATVGLGRDAFVLARLGCRVLACERAPVVAALLEDGLDRAAAQRSAGEPFRFELLVADARDVLPTHPHHVAYLDPMHPPRRKSALVRKEMRVLRRVLGADADADTLLELALAHAQLRVVVKRPRHAPPLGERVPQRVVEGRRVRFDIYDAGRN